MTYYLWNHDGHRDGSGGGVSTMAEAIHHLQLQNQCGYKHIWLTITHNPYAPKILAMEAGIMILKDNDFITINGMYGHIGTIHGFALRNNEDPDETIQREIDNGRSINPYTVREATCLCSDPGYYDERDARWASAIPIEDGQQVVIEDKTYHVKFMGDYSDFVHFV